MGNANIIRIISVPALPSCACSHIFLSASTYYLLGLDQDLRCHCAPLKCHTAMLCLIINCIQVASPSYSATHQSAGGCQTFPLWKRCFHMLISQPLCETWISLSTPFCLKAPSRARISEILRRCWIIVQCFWGSYLPKKDRKALSRLPREEGVYPLQ